MVEQKPISRRALFTGATEKKSPETVKSVYVPELGTVQLVHSVHLFASTLEELGSSAAIALETGVADIYGSDETMHDFMSQVSESQIYGTILSEAKRRQPPLPVFLIDIHVSPKDIEVDERVGKTRNPGYIDRRDLMLKGGTAVAIAATTVGLKMGSDVVLEAVVPEDLRPKNLVAELFPWVASAAAATGVVAKVLVDSQRSPSNPIRRYFKASADEKKARGFLDFTIKLRDLLFADKFVAALEVCRELGIEEPTISGFVGADHIEGVTEALALDPKERRTFIRELVEHIGERKFDDYDGVEVMRRILRDASVLPMAVWSTEKKDWKIDQHEIAGPSV